MTTRAEVRRALLHAGMELERSDPAALDECLRWVIRAHFALLDLKGSPGAEPPSDTRPPAGNRESGGGKP